MSPTLDELKVLMSKAIESGDLKAIEEVASQITKSKADRIKVEAEAQRKEAEALAGTREALAAKIHKAIRKAVSDDELKSVKAWGFTYKVDKANPAEPDIEYKSVMLLTPNVKAPRTSTGTASTGKTKNEFGLSLQEVFDKFATDEDKAKLAEAEIKDKEATAKLGRSTNSNAWRIKNEVKKHAIASGLLAPSK